MRKTRRNYRRNYRRNFICDASRMVSSATGSRNPLLGNLSSPISRCAGHRGWAEMRGQKSIHVGHAGQTFKTAPERLRSGLSVAFAAEVPPEGADHAHGFAKKWCWVIRRNGLTDGVGHQSF